MSNINIIVLFFKIVKSIIISLVFLTAVIIIFLIVIDNSNIEIKLNISNKSAFIYEIFFNKK